MCADFREKRKYPRLDFSSPMRYRKLKTDDQQFKGSLMRNISEGGVMMAIYEFLSLNLNLSIEIPLGTGTAPMKGTCRVVRIKKAAFSEQYDAGLEFVTLSQEDVTRIAKFIFNKSS